MHPHGGSDIILELNIAACIASAAAAITTFVLYVKARMADRSEDPRLDATRMARRLSELDRKERRYQSIHYITLSLFFFLGVLLLIQLAIYYNGPFGSQQVRG